MEKITGETCIVINNCSSTQCNCLSCQFHIFPQFKDTKITEIDKVIHKQEDAKTSESHIIPGKASLGISKQLTKLTKKETIVGFGTKSDAQLVTKV